MNYYMPLGETRSKADTAVRLETVGVEMYAELTLINK